MNTEFSIAMCDDDYLFLDGLKEEVSRIMEEKNYRYKIFECYDGKELVSYCKKNRVDIVLADIDIPEMNGFEATEELKKLRPELAVIFVTAHDELAYQAFDYQPFWFVSKSDLDKLKSVLLKLARKIEARKESNDIFLLQMENLIEINVNEVMYIVSYKNYLSAYNKDGSVTEFRGSVRDAYDQLITAGFVRVQRSYIVNCRFIEHFGKRYAVLKNGKQISVTRDNAKIKEAQTIYREFMREQRW